MVSKTYNRYVWLLNLLLQKKKMSFAEISECWKNSALGDGRPMPLRTFHQHRDAVEELFDIKIDCKVVDGDYLYSIADASALKNDRARQWLINSFSLSNVLDAGRNLNGRVLFETIPHGTEYLQDIIEAMRDNTKLSIDYQQFGQHRRSFVMSPYAMKVNNRRWYLIGPFEGSETLKSIALDRILDLKKSNETFVLPADFNAEKYYSPVVGIYVNDSLKPQKVLIRVHGASVDYIRSLSLHKSQEEVHTVGDQYSEFQYRVCLTPDLIIQILSFGDNVEVLEPAELRNMMKAKIQKMLSYYL